jgi:hypothetical protein
MFYLHEFGNIDATFGWDYDRFFYDRWCTEARAALAAHPDCTTEPETSDCSIALATLRCLSFASPDWGGLFQNLSSLLRRNPRKKYLVFDFTDYPRPILTTPGAIVCKAAWHEHHYVGGSSISIPQFPRYQWSLPCVPASQRRFLAGFKGDLRQQCQSLRTRLLALHNDHDFIVQAAVLTPAHIRVTPSGQATEATPAGEFSYVDLLHNSTFALLPRGCGHALVPHDREHERRLHPDHSV